MFKKVHSSKYTYPNYKFINNTQKVKFLCPVHGEQCGIETNHLKGYGCKKCSRLGTPPMTNEDFLSRVAKLNSGIEILETRKGYHTPILCRNKYGLVKVSPDHLLKGSIGSFRSALDKTAYMIERFKEKHNSKYSYPNYEYCGNRCDTKIHCELHGEFVQSTDVHLMGSGCTPCSFLEGKRVSGHSRSSFKAASKSRNCILYIVEMYDDYESFYKIGITSKSVYSRFKKKSIANYKYRVLHEYKSWNSDDIWNLEKKLHKEHKTYSYKPIRPFPGQTECFSLDLPVEEIINTLKVK